MKTVLTCLTLAALVVTAAAAAAHAGDDFTFTPIQHATFLIQHGDLTIFVDPVGDAKTFAEFSTPDIILITDIHGDHLNPDVVKALRGKNTVVIGPKAVTDKLDKAKALANGESTLIDGVINGVMVEAVPAYNTTKERLKFHEKGRGNGYVLTIAKKRIYISGDTEDIPEMRALEDIDYAFVCMNLPYTMTVEQAASAVLEMEPKVVFPYHYRGQGGMSDTKKFTSLVAKNKKIEVRLLEWYK